MDDYTPRYSGDTFNPLQITLQDNEGTAYNLTGLNTSTAFTLELINMSSGIVTTGAGTWTIINAAQGVVQYQWVAGDVALAGMYRIKVVITFTGGILTFDQKLLEILP